MEHKSKPMTQATDQATAQIYFSDFFDVAAETIEEYGAFNISLVNDLPLFIDPFLLFRSPDPTYQHLHDDIIHYLRFLREKSLRGPADRGLLQAWYQFKEIKQNWLGFSKVGNSGSALGPDFARSLDQNLGTIFSTFGQEKVTRGSHLEKVSLVSAGIGRDKISDFTTSLIKEHLLGYTQIFAQAHLRPEQRRGFSVSKARFHYDTETWEPGLYELPHYAGDFVLLTPKNMLTRDEIWISRGDLENNFEQIAQAVPDAQLRALLNNYLYSQLSNDPKMSAKDREREKFGAIARTIRRYPEVIEYYIRQKEDDGDRAVAISSEKVSETEALFVEQVHEFVASHLVGTAFYDFSEDTLEEARRRALFLKHVIEDQDGYRFFYVKGEPIERESDLQLLYRLTWFATPSDVNREANNGRGPVDFKISRGSRDASLVEFKLASNSQLRRNLQNQVPIYEAANLTRKSLKVICYFSPEELDKVHSILRELQLEGNPNIILIDARSDNKPSASKA